MRIAKRKIKIGESVFKAIIFIFLFVATTLIVVPLLWGVINSFKNVDEYQIFENVLGFPQKIVFENYAHVLKALVIDVDGYPVGIFEMYVNSIIFAIGGSLIQTFVTCAVAYTIAKYDKPFSKFLYFFVLAASSLQIVGALPSEIQVAKFLGIYDNLIGMFVMRCHFLNIYFLFFYAGAKGISKSLYEAAEIDGAGEYRVFFTIGLPMMRSVFLTVFLLFAIASWNDYQVPMVYLPSYPTISYGVYHFFVSTNNNTSVPNRLTGCMFLLLPMLLIYIIFNKKLLENVSMGGVKE